MDVFDDQNRILMKEEHILYMVVCKDEIDNNISNNNVQNSENSISVLEELVNLHKCSRR